MKEYDLAIDENRLRVREAGDPNGELVIHFHGTPGCRTELAFADDIAEVAGVRLVTFDRPGYGGSTQVPFSLTSLGAMAVQVADHLGVDGFRTTGFSGGGPFALATAASAGPRVKAVGVMSGPGPFQLVPGALDELSDGDKAALQRLPDRQAACEGFVQALSEDMDVEQALENAASLYQSFEPLLSETDREIWGRQSEQILAEMREALTQGAWGYAWDNVAWLGPWDYDPTAVECPVLLWYGAEDRMAPPSHAQWFASNLRNGRLTMHKGEGHLLPFAHLEHMLKELLSA